MIAKPYFNLLNICIKLDSKKYKERRPNMAKIFDTYKINGSLGAIAKIAGIESTANNKSVNSITPTTTNKGVATLTPFSTVKNLSLSNSLLVLNNLYMNFAPGLLLKS